MSKTYSFQKYVVAFLDLVGQRDATRRLRSIPTTAAEGKEFIELAQESVGTVLELRRHFNNYFAVMKDDQEDLPGLPAELRAKLAKPSRLRNTRCWGCLTLL